MKLFSVIVWACGTLAIALMLLGSIALITDNNLFGVRHEANYFIVASSLLLLGILCVLARQGCCCNKKD